MEIKNVSLIGVPYSEYTYHAVKALEEKNAGLIS